MISPNTAVPFAAGGLVRVEPAGLASYVVMADGQVFLFSPGHGRLDPVPAAAHAAIRDAHPGTPLRFPETSAGIDAGAAGDLFEVDPTKLNLLYEDSGELPQKEILKGSGETLEGDWDVPKDKRFEEIDNYLALRDVMRDRSATWESTRLYRRVVGEIAAGKVKWGCRTEAEFRGRCAELERLYERISTDGYKTQMELGTAKPEDEVRIAIARDGRLLFIDGRHRLAIARLLGLPSIPVRIVARHGDWTRFKERLLKYAANHRGRIYQRIDHPDLSDIPAQHTTDRIDMLRSALAGYDASGKKLLDLGTHWGYMAQQFEKLGFECTGVEASPSNRRIAEALAVATESRYTVWGGNLLDFPTAEEQNVVLALNIFHHLIKTEELHEALTTFLHRLKADRILFEPHRHDPPGQMEGAYRNYAPDEFARFVAEHAGMSTVTELGQAADGRTLFSIA